MGKFVAQILAKFVAKLGAQFAGGGRTSSAGAPADPGPGSAPGTRSGQANQALLSILAGLERPSSMAAFIRSGRAFFLSTAKQKSGAKFYPFQTVSARDVVANIVPLIFH